MPRRGRPHAIGLVVNLEPKDPATDVPADLAAAARADAYMNRQYLDPVFFGRYPEELPEIFGAAWPALSGGGLRGDPAPLDFVGVNYYSRRRPRRSRGVHGRLARAAGRGAPHGDRTGRSTPRACSGLLTWVTRVTETSPSTWRRTGPRFPTRRRRRPAASSTRSARRTCASICGRRAGPRARRRPPRVLRVVAPRQLRVGVRLLEALRDRPRRPRDAGAHAQGERALFLGRDPDRRELRWTRPTLT